MLWHLKDYQKSITLIKTGRLKQNDTNMNTAKTKMHRKYFYVDSTVITK